jgi:hypothetical protein
MEDSASTTSLSHMPPPISPRHDLDHNHETIDEDEREIAIRHRGVRSRCVNFQIPIHESWLDAIDTIVQGLNYVVLDVVDTFRRPLMNSKTLSGVSILLLVFDRILVYMSELVDTLLLAPTQSATTTTRTADLLPMEVPWQNKLVDTARLHLSNSIGFLVNFADLHQGTGGSSAANNQPETCVPGEASDNSTIYNLSYSMAGSFLLLATALVFMANTSYFGMLMTPLYSRIMDASSTEFLLCLLLFLFGIEILTVLAFFLLGYRILLSPTVVTELLTSNGSGGGIWILDDHHDHSVLADFNQQQADLDASETAVNILLFLSMIIWIFCVLASTVVRLALYHSMGE